MANWFTKLFSKEAQSAVPDLGMQSHPLRVNPGRSAKAARAAGRIATLMDAIASGDPRPELRRSLITYQAQLVALGHDVPETADEARAMSKELA
jgi:hypothetical protein